MGQPPEAGAFVIVDAQAHPLIGLVQLLSAFTRVPPGLEAGQRFYDTIAVDPIVTLVRARVGRVGLPGTVSATISASSRIR